MDSTQDSTGLVPSIAPFNKKLSPQNKKISADELSANDSDNNVKQAKVAPKIQIKFEKDYCNTNNGQNNENILNIKAEKNSNNSQQAGLNYNELIVALWNMVETENSNSSTTTTTKNRSNRRNRRNLPPIIGRLGDTNNTLIINNHNTSLHTNKLNPYMNHSNTNNMNSNNSINNLSDDYESKKSNKSNTSPPPQSATNSLLCSPILTPPYSSRKKRFKSQETPNFCVLEYCPNYESYDARARKESKERISSHLKERQKLVKKCIKSTIQEIDNLGLQYGRDYKNIKFDDNNDILANALLQLKQQIDKWDGVQIKQCKKEEDDGTKIIIDTWPKFAKKAKNHQDQTSWKISGDYFFAPYIRKVKPYIDRYCRSIIHVAEHIKTEIIKFGCISFAMLLLNGKIKFHRTKLKPLIRHRTLVKSNGIHIELENLFSKLTVRKFIQNAKAKRKKNDGKSNIIAGDFYNVLVGYIEKQYQTQKKIVYDLLNKNKNKNNNNKKAKYKYKYKYKDKVKVNKERSMDMEMDMEMDTNKYKRVAMSLVTPNIALTPIPLLPMVENNAHITSLPIFNNTIANIPSITSIPVPSIPSIPNNIAASIAYSSSSIPCIPCIPTIPNIANIPFTMNRDFTVPNHNNHSYTNINAQVNTQQVNKKKKRKRNNNNIIGDECDDNNPKKKMKRDKTGQDIKVEYKTDFEYILSSCNGSCGNKLGLFIASIVDSNNHYQLLSEQEKLDILSHKFGEYGNKMRDYFVSLINDNELNNNLHLHNEYNSNLFDNGININDLLLNLQNENVYISHVLSKDKKWISIFVKAFKSLLINNKAYILQKLVDKSCKRCNLELLEEIEINIKHISTSIDFYRYHEKIEKVKKTNNYKMMKLQGKGLTNNEIIAVYAFITNQNISNQLIKYGNTCKWKQLYQNLCSAINKIYKIFIYKNNQNNLHLPKQLFHANHKNNISYVSNNPWIFHTINILYRNIDNALQIMKNNNNGCVLKLTNIQNDLYNGQLIAAPIDWIINCGTNNVLHDQQWISLPTIFKNAKFQKQTQTTSYWTLTVHQSHNKNKNNNKNNQDILSISSESQTTE